jgi:hypothetical protein
LCDGVPIVTYAAHHSRSIPNQCFAYVINGLFLLLCDLDHVLTITATAATTIATGTLGHTRSGGTTSATTAKEELHVQL